MGYADESVKYEDNGKKGKILTEQMVTGNMRMSTMEESHTLVMKHFGITEKIFLDVFIGEKLLQELIFQIFILS